MPMRSLLLQNVRKTCCNTLYPQIRYASRYPKNDGGIRLPKVLENQIDKFREKFPKLSGLYSVVYGGIRGTLNDIKEWIRLESKVAKAPGKLKDLSLDELLSHHTLRQDLRKLIPIILLGVIPFGNFLLIPLVYFSPRKLVTPHFWMEHQKSTFAYQNYEERLQYHEPIIYYFDSCASGRIPDDILPHWRAFMDKLVDGERTTPEEVAKVASLFHQNGPFHLLKLPKLHIGNLGAIYNVPSIFAQTKKLVYFSRFNLILDEKIMLRGGPKKVYPEILSKICLMRGVDSMNMSRAQQIEYIEKWIQVNCNVNHSNYSLLLHTPILLGYNKPHVKSVKSSER